LCLSSIIIITLVIKHLLGGCYKRTVRGYRLLCCLNQHATVVYSLSKTISSAIAERPRCRDSQFWQKVEDDILQTI